MEAYLQVFPKHESEVLMKTSQHYPETSIGADTEPNGSRQIPSEFSSAVDFHMGDTVRENNGDPAKISGNETAVSAHHNSLKNTGRPDTLNVFSHTQNFTGSLCVNEKDVGDGEIGPGSFSDRNLSASLSQRGKLVCPYLTKENRSETKRAESSTLDTRQDDVQQKRISVNFSRSYSRETEHVRIVGLEPSTHDLSGKMKIAETVEQGPKAGELLETVFNPDENTVDKIRNTEFAGNETGSTKTNLPSNALKLPDITSSEKFPENPETVEKQSVASVYHSKVIFSKTGRNTSPDLSENTITHKTHTAGNTSAEEVKAQPQIGKNPNGLNPSHLSKTESRIDAVNPINPHLADHPTPDISSTNTSALNSVADRQNMNTDKMLKLLQNNSKSRKSPETSDGKTNLTDAVSNHRREFSENAQKEPQPITDKPPTNETPQQGHKENIPEKFFLPEFKSTDRTLSQGDSLRFETNPEITNRNVLSGISHTPLNVDNLFGSHKDLFIQTDTISGIRDAKSPEELKAFGIPVEARDRAPKSVSLNLPQFSGSSKAEIHIHSPDKKGLKILSSENHKTEQYILQEAPDTQNREVLFRSNRPSFNPSGENTANKSHLSVLSAGAPAALRDQKLSDHKDENLGRQNRRSNLGVNRRNDRAIAKTDFSEHQVASISESGKSVTNFISPNNLGTQHVETHITVGTDISDSSQEPGVLNREAQTLNIPPGTGAGSNSDMEQDAFFEKVTKPVMNQVTEKIKYTYSQGKSTVNLELKPESLGHLRVDISSESNQVSIRILAETSMAKEIIEQEIYQLKGGLRDSGLEVEKLDVYISQDSKQHQHAGKGSERAIFQSDLSEEPEKETIEKQPQASTKNLGIPNSSGVDFFA